MKFAIFDHPVFVQALCETYRMQELAALDPAAPGYLPFYRSRLPFKRKQAFALPFTFYRTADDLRERWRGDQWAQVCAYSRRQGINITLQTVGELGLGEGSHSADNPVLSLGDGDVAAGYSRNLRSNLKKEWNKCHRLGVRVAFSDDEADLRQFYRVLATQYVREHRMVFQPYALYCRLLQAPLTGKLLVARTPEGQVVGGLILIADQGVLHYCWGARSQQANLAIGTVLIDHAIRFAKQAGFTHFDFGSTPASDHALLDFKLRWGADKLPVWRYHTLQLPADIDLNSSYSGPRRWFSKLPVPVAERLMPHVVPWLLR
ncbi:MAG: GNAT family N-acetyltransferase [Burkholderiaceae bacterium]|nr:GNAT family N-acetyltransferase [Burkholderiaceae bacterium]